MKYFNPKPDLFKISKYHAFQEPISTLQETFPHGFPIKIDRVPDDKMEEFTKQFILILENYRLVEHANELLFLILMKVIYIDQSLEASITQNNAVLKAKELSTILLAYEINEGSLPPISLKLQNNPCKISDPSLLQWIGQLINNAIINGDMPLELMHMFEEYLFIDIIDGERIINVDKVKDIHKRKVQQTSTYINQYQQRLKSEFCFCILPYLNNETHLSKKAGTNFSDEQLTFLHDIMVLFEVSGDRIFDKVNGYESKDLLRNILSKYIKS